jgi:hypothetical protein
VIGALNHCDEQGALVGTLRDVPEDSSEYQWHFRSPLVGCNRLRCGNCGVLVRSRGGYHARIEAKDHGREVWESADWSGFPFLDHGSAQAQYRLYVCHCGYAQLADIQSVEYLEERDLSWAWRCDGHPPPELPVRWGGVEISTETDLLELVRRVKESDASPFHPTHLRARLAGTALEAAVERAAEVCLTDASRAVRLVALGFYYTHPRALGAGRMLELMQGDRALFAGVPDQLSVGNDGEARLVFTVAHLYEAGAMDPAEVGTVLRAEALRPGKARPVVAALCAKDTDWVIQHASEIVRATPAAAPSVIAGVAQARMVRFDIVAFARPLLDTPGINRAHVREEIERRVVGNHRIDLLALVDG